MKTEHPRLAKLFLWLLILVTAIADFIHSQFSDKHTFSRIQWITDAAILFGWCIFHARMAGVPVPFASAFLSGIVPPLGIPIYFFRAFEFQSATIKTIRALGYFALLTVTSVEFENLGKWYIS